MSIGRSLHPQRTMAHHRPPRRRGRARSDATIDAAVPTERTTRPIDGDEVRRIASKGYPLWESVEVMQLRTRRIAIGYSDLSRRLAELMAGDDGRLDANWCTFATWSSMTITTWIAKDAVPEPLRNVKRMPRFVVRWLVEMCRRLIQRSNGLSYRCLAAGNRFLFLEIGLSVAWFLDAFKDVDRSKPNEADWDAYVTKVRGLLGELGRLDPSWLLTETPPAADIELGLRQYYEALFVSDAKQRSELILTGTMLLGAYEQRRVDGYVSASLALFSDRAMRNLVRQRSGLVTGWLHRGPSTVYARLMTRGLVWDTADEQFKVARRLPPSPEAARPTALFPPDLETITNPLLQALLTRYDLSEGRPEGCRVRDWTRFDERMSYITNLFRSRQLHAALFDRPFPPEVEVELLAGRLA